MDNQNSLVSLLNSSIPMAIVGLVFKNDLWHNPDDFDNAVYTGKSLGALSELNLGVLPTTQPLILDYLNHNNQETTGFSLIYLPFQKNHTSERLSSADFSPHKLIRSVSESSLIDALEQAAAWLADDPLISVLVYTSGHSIALRHGDLVDRTKEGYLAKVTPVQKITGEAGFIDSTDLPGEAMKALIKSAFKEPRSLSCCLITSPGDEESLGPGLDLYRLSRAVMCLHHRYYPAWPAEVRADSTAPLAVAPFFRTTMSLPWFVSDGQARQAWVSSKKHPGDISFIPLQEAATPVELGNSYLGSQEMRLYLFGQTESNGLMDSLARLETEINKNTELDGLSFDLYRQFCAARDFRFGLALIASTPQELLQEIQSARAGIPRAIEGAGEWQTPNGSYFTVSPLGKEAPVAFVYPGAFNSFIHIGKDLFHLFPEILDFSTQVSKDFGAVLGETSLYPRSTHPLTSAELETFEVSLNRDPVTMLTSGTALSVLYTHILQQTFGIHPSSAFGYSLGEISMLFAMQVWQEGDEGYRRLSSSPLFHTRLSGPKEAVKEYWGISPHEKPILWVNKILMCPEEKAREAIRGYDRVYITHINTPNQVVIAGDSEQCTRVVERLRLPSITAPFDHVLHCDPVISEYDELTKLHSFPVSASSEVKLFSAAVDGSLELNSRFLAQSVARALCTCLDFPRLIHQVYADGARVFIETGAGSNCSRWIDETLKEKPHLSVAISRKGSDDFRAILRMLARLAVHQIPVDLKRLYRESW